MASSKEFFVVLVVVCVGVSPATVFGNSQQEIFDSFLNAVNTYSVQLDRTIDWTRIDNTINNLHRHKNLFSTSSGTILGSVIVHTNDAKDYYYGASREIFHWCTASKPYVEAYIQLFDMAKVPPISIAESQKFLMKLILNDGLAKMTTGLENIKHAKSSLTQASSKLSELDVSLMNDGKQQIEQLEKRIQENRATSIALIVVNIIAAAIYFTVSEVHTVPQLRAKIEESKNSFKEFDRQIDDAIAAIEVARNAMTKEMDRITELHASTEQTYNFMNLPAVIVAFIKQSGQNLLGQCQSFVNRHSSS